MFIMPGQMFSIATVVYKSLIDCQNNNKLSAIERHPERISTILVERFKGVFIASSFKDLFCDKPLKQKIPIKKSIVANPTKNLASLIFKNV